MMGFPTFLYGLFVVAILIFGPLLVIWALNTLFALSIAYNFWTWAATIVLVIAITPPSTKD